VRDTAIVTLLMMFALSFAGPLTADSPDGSVIYLHHFAGPKNKGLNGQAPKIRPDKSAWKSAGWKADGTIEGKNNSASAWLPFTPKKGHVYTLSLEVHPDKAKDQSDWFFLGFCASDNTGLVMGHKPLAWMITRARRGAGAGQSFLGPEAAREGNHDVHNGPVKLKILLDTRPNPWTVQWFVKDKSVRGPDSFPGPTIIRQVGFGKYNSAGGRVAHFQLTMDQELEPLPTAKTDPAKTDPTKIGPAKMESQPVGYRLYLNLGGKEHVDASKRTWVPTPPYRDGGYGYVGGEVAKRDEKQKNELSATAIVGLKSVRISVPDGVYAVSLIFVEHWLDKPGQRRIWVKMENKIIVRDLDVFAATGGKAKPWVKVFPKMRVKDGTIDVEFIAKKPGAPTMISGLSVEQVHFVQGSTASSTGRAAANINDDSESDLAQAHAAKAEIALKEANHLLEKDLVKGYLAIKRIASRFTGTEPGRTAAEKAEDLLGDPKTGRPIKRAIKENEAQEEMRFIKLYIKQKNYEVAYQKLRKILRDYRTTTVSKEAKGLLEKVRDLRKPNP
jgi:hypothetical protein